MRWSIGTPLLRKILALGLLPRESLPNSRLVAMAAVRQKQMKQIENLMAGYIATMQATRPDIIRAAPASSALACCAKPLRGFGGRNFLHYSSPISQNSRIKEFWSHSWHGPRWMVVMTVLLLNNSLAAIVFSTLVSFLLGLFYAMDRLPPLEGPVEYDALVSRWCQWGGMVVYVLTLFFWPSRKKIFLDLLCIDQTNESEKHDALLSMGAFLKQSDSLIVFWDQTFTSYYMGTPLKAKPAQGSKAEDEADVGKNDEAKKEEAEAGDKRPAISSPVKDRPAKKQTLETKPPHGLVARANPGGGNCVFEAIGQGVDKPARAVRASIVGHIKRHEGRYKPWWDGKEPSQEENECESWQKYLSSISKQGAWGGSLEIAAAAAHFDRSIVVFQPTGVPEIYNRHGKAGKTLALWFRAKHYELLEGELPKQIAEQAANGPMQGGRGGSDSNVSSQGRTRLSALPSLKSTASHKRARSMSPLPSSSFSERRRKLSPAAASSGRGVNAPTAAASSTDGKTATSSSARTEWKCPLCDFSTGPCRLWGQRKRAHIAAWHPEETESLSLRTLPALQPNSSKVQMRWKCPICNLGIPADLQINKDQYLRMRRKHHDEAHPEADLKLFKLDDSFRKVNVAKATQQVRAASFARRLLGIKKGDAGKHDPLLVSLPACNRTKNNNRTSFSKVICRKCGTIADRAKQLAKLRCEKFGSRGPKRKALIKRLRACLDKPSVSDNLKEGARTVLDIIDPGVPDTHSTQTHVVEALVWPTDFSVKFACVQCKRCVTRENRLRGPCNNQITWNQLRKGYKETLSKFACQQPGVRQRAAVRALQVLALENNEEGEQCP